MKTTAPVLAALLTFAATQPAAAQQDASLPAIFALMDKNEWCPGGSVYVDLQTGSYLLYPRVGRLACNDRHARIAVERGAIIEEQLQLLRSAYADARRAGLKRQNCTIIISNGGPEALVITGSGFSAITPADEGCWSTEARAFHTRLFDIFGTQRKPVN